MRAWFLAGLVLCASSPADATGRNPAIYLVFEVGDDGFRLIHRREVVLSAPLHSLSEPELRGAERDADPRGRGVSVSLADARGQVVFRQHLEIPEWIRGEFHGQPEGSGWQVDAHAVPDPTPAFAIRVPAGLGRELRLHGRNRAGVVDLAAPALSDEPPAPVALAAEALGGDPANRLDLLLIGNRDRESQDA
jgi:hypothetical protein